MDNHSITNGEGLGNEEYYDRKQGQEQFDERQKVEQKKIELQQKNLEIQQQQQNSNQTLVLGGLFLGGTLVIAIIAYLVVRAIKGGSKIHKKS